MPHVLLAAEIFGGTVVGLWVVAYIVEMIRGLIHGPDIAMPVDAAFAAAYELKAAREGWVHRWLVAFDICVNVLFRGQPDETISGRSWRASLENKMWGRVMNYWLGLFENQHGAKACVGDLQRAKNRIAINSKVLGL